jgi:hypothetical protein
MGKQAKAPVDRNNLVLAGKEVDRRTIHARRYAEVLVDLAAQLGDAPTKADEILLGRAAALTVMLELSDTTMAQGQGIDTAEYARLTGSLVTVLRQLGLSRKSRGGMKTIVVDAHTAALADDG